MPQAAHCFLRWSVAAASVRSGVRDRPRLGRNHNGAGDVGIHRNHQADAESSADELGHDEGGTEAGAIPAKVSLKIRSMVTAGLANDVEEVNQYAALM
ncbi:MAG: hypothetical protein ACRDRH_19330 [Pseudonocardia sp.]